MEALLRPAKPLYIGRKACMPTTPLVFSPAEPLIRAATAYDALRRNRDPKPALWPAYGPYGTTEHATNMTSLAQETHWQTQIRAGNRILATGTIVPEQIIPEPA